MTEFSSFLFRAHKAADPAKFPPRNESRALYPPLVGIEERFSPTQVHLQVYDGVHPPYGQIKT